MENTLMGVVIPTNRIEDFAPQMSIWIADSLKLGIQVAVVVDTRETINKVDIENILGIQTNELLVIVIGDYRSPGLARNAGMAAIDSKWVCFWDCDDVPNPENMLNGIRKSDSRNVEIFVGSYEIQIVQSSEIPELKILKKPCLGNLDEIFMEPGIWRFAFNRSLNEIPTFLNLRMGEDQVFLASMDLGSKKLCFSERSVYRYIQHAKGSLTTDSDAWRDLQNTINSLYGRMNLHRGKNRRLLWISITNQVIAFVRRDRSMKRVVVLVVYLARIIHRPSLLSATSYVVRRKIRSE